MTSHISVPGRRLTGASQIFGEAQGGWGVFPPDHLVCPSYLKFGTHPQLTCIHTFKVSSYQTNQKLKTCSRFRGVLF
jgi:hypothetical protein